MLERIIGAVADRLAPVPVDGVYGMAALKEAHPVTGKTTNATMAQARALVADALAAIKRASYGSYDVWLPDKVRELYKVLAVHDERHSPRSGWCTCPRRWEAGDGLAEVGSLSDVSRLFNHEHFVGMEITAGDSGWTLEHLELLSSSFEVIRHNGRIRGFQTGTIMRMESRGGIRYI